MEDDPTELPLQVHQAVRCMLRGEMSSVWEQGKLCYLVELVRLCMCSYKCYVVELSEDLTSIASIQYTLVDH